MQEGYHVLNILCHICSFSNEILQKLEIVAFG